jgi:[protein-PII] uridylyltransferase
MLTLAKEIIDKKHLAKSIGKAASLADLRVAAMPVIAEAYTHAKDVIRQRFVMTPKGANFIESNAYIIDTIIEVLTDIASRHIKTSNIAIIAVGGYGRKELFPCSDIDLLFLHEKHHEEDAQFVEWLLYCLWDIGLTIGHAVRNVEETITLARKDVTIATSLLDARLICSNAEVFKSFTTAYDEYINGSSVIDFVEAKLSERDARHTKLGDSRYVLEPNIKEGKGGLRDLHTLYWLAKYIYRIESMEELVRLKVLNREEYKSYVMADEFLWLVRVHLHLIAGRAEERLTFDMQRAIAEALGYNEDSVAHSVERFMKKYFLVARTVGNLTRSICAVLEENGKRKPKLDIASRSAALLGVEGFRLDGERIAVDSEDVFRKKPETLITLFEVAHERGLDIHPHTFQLVTRSLWLVDAGLRRNTEANEAFMRILLSRRNPEHTLRLMSEAGVLGKFIPDFGRVAGQMQFDMYHVFTVDEHTIFALGILHNIGAGKYKDDMPLANEIFPLVKSKRALFLSLLCHDIAKGRGGNHSLLGEFVVRKLARRFHFDPYEIETCAWLVRNHLLMSRTAFKRDLSDDKTIEDFVAAVQSPERLRLLLLLTVPDIRAVGPNVWNGWKGSLLRELYYAAEDKMGASDRRERKSDTTRLREEMTAMLPGWKPDAIDDYLQQIGKPLSASLDGATHARIARILREMENSELPLVLDTRSDTFRSITEIILCTPDNTGLFSKTSGAIALAGANILSAKIFTLKSGAAIQMFHIQDTEGQAFDKPDKLARLAVFMNQAVEGSLDLVNEIAASRMPYPSRMEVFKIPTHVVIENKVSVNHTVIEVSGRDRIGFLYKVTSALAELQLTIFTAHITTYGERAVDVFYVKDIFGMKVFHESKLRQIQERLVAALDTNGHEKGKKTA